MSEHNELVIIELDKPRTLKLTHRAMKRFSAATKMAIVDFDTLGTRYDYIAEMLYTLLNEDDPRITHERADELLNSVSISYIMEKYNEVVSAAFGNPDDAESDPQTAAGTGTEA